MRVLASHLWIVAALLSVVMVSCGREEPEDQKKPEDFDVNEWENTDIDGDATMSHVMSFSVGDNNLAVEDEETIRSVTAYDGTCTFEAGDLVAVAVTRSGESEVIKLYRIASDGTSLNYAGSDNEPFIWHSKSETVSVRAWSYGTSTLIANTLTAPENYDYTLETNQQTNGYRELLYCKAANRAYSTNTALNFYHQLSRVVFNVKHERTGALSVSSTSVGSSSFPISARFSVPTGSSNVGSWTIKAAKGSITPKTETTQSGYQKTYSAVVFPNKYTQSTQFFTVTNSDGNYVYNISEYSDVTLTAGNQYNYTITVNNGTFRRNPLYYVAKYYLNSSKTFDTTASEEQGYLWKQETMMTTKFVASSSSYNGYQLPTGEHSISGVPYHMPTANEWVGIIPFTSNLLSTSVAAGTILTEDVCTFGADTTTKTAKQYKSYWNTYGDNYTRYAIRFIGTKYCSAWRYRMVGTEAGNNRALEITSVLIDQIGENTTQLSTKMTQLTNGTFTWPTADNESMGAFVRTFYVSGYISGGEGRGGIISKGTDGFCPSTTNYNSTGSWAPRFGSGYGTCMSEALNNNGRPIRLFRDR